MKKKIVAEMSIVITSYEAYESIEATLERLIIANYYY